MLFRKSYFWDIISHERGILGACVGNRHGSNRRNSEGFGNSCISVWKTTILGIKSKIKLISDHVLVSMIATNTLTIVGHHRIQPFLFQGRCPIPFEPSLELLDGEVRAREQMTRCYLLFQLQRRTNRRMFEPTVPLAN